MRHKSILLFLILLICQTHVYGQNAQSSGKDFWFGYMENLFAGINGYPQFTVQIFAIAGDADVTIEIPKKNYTFSFSVTQGQVIEADLPPFDLEPRGSGVIADLGIHITSTTDIEVVAIHNRRFFSATTRLFPRKSLGKEHVILAAEDILDLSPSAFLVVATEDNTTVSVCASPCGTKGEFSFNLNKGQTYQFQSPEDLSGTVVVGDKPIAVFSGAKQAALIEGDDSHIFIAMPPVEYAATEFAVVPNRQLNNQTYLALLGISDNTEITVNDSTITVNRGERKDIKINNAMVISSTKPMFVGQYNNGSKLFLMGGTYGPSLALIQPLSSKVKRMSFKPKEDFAMSNLVHSITLIVEDTTGVRLNNEAIPNFVAFPNSSYFYSAQKIEDKIYQITAPSGFIGQAYGSSAAEYYTFSLGYNDTNLVNPNGLFTSADCDNWKIASNLNDGSFKILTNEVSIKGGMIEIFDTNGRLVYKNANIASTNQLFRLNLSPGMYFARLNACNSVKKFVVAN